MNKRRILIVDASEELRTLLAATLGELGHEVVSTGDRAEALARDDLEEFDLIISDLTDEADAPVGELKRKRLMIPVAVAAGEAQPQAVIKAFKLGAANFVRRPSDHEELRTILDKTLALKLRSTEDLTAMPFVREHIEFELPSELSLMNGVLHYLIERVARLGVIRPERSNLFIALDEAFVNAVKHGNKNDPTKIVRITADLSAGEARFSVEDEGDGFDPHSIPDPLDPTNLFKSSGRGVLLIYNIMDEVKYNERGNRLTMVKRPEGALGADLVEAVAPAETAERDAPARKG